MNTKMLLTFLLIISCFVNVVTSYRFINLKNKYDTTYLIHDECNKYVNFIQNTIKNEFRDEGKAINKNTQLYSISGDTVYLGDIIKQSTIIFRTSQ